MKKLFSLIIAIALAFSLFPTGKASAAISKKDLQAYLAEINMTEAELKEYLSYFGESIKDYDTVEKLRDMLGPVLTPATLQELLDTYELTEAELTDLLIEYGELEPGETILDTFHFVYDVEFIIMLDLGISDIDWSEIFNEMAAEFKQIGLDEDEMERFINHVLPIFEEPDFENRLFALGERMMQIGDFETADELTAQQIAEIIAIYDEIADLFQIQFKFYLVKDGKKIPISLAELAKIEAIYDEDLIVEIYDLRGNFLLNLIFTGEMFGSEIIQNVGKDLKETPQMIEKAKNEPKTVKGAKMPKTAGNYGLYIILGLCMMGLAFLLFRKVRAN